LSRRDEPGAENSSEHRSAKAELAERGLRPKRSLGQNFLADDALCRKIAAVVARDRGGVLEIGAGLGALTGALLALGNPVLAVETDRELASVLRGKFAAQLATEQLTLLEADAREVELGALLQRLPAPRTLAGNLPYQLSGLLLRRAVDLSPAAERSVFLLQLEVVDRLCAEPGSPAYGALSVFVQAVFAPRRAFVVRRGAFYPQPAVDSAVVVLEPLDPGRSPLSEQFSMLVRAAFEKRRKTLRNAWRGVAGLDLPELEGLARQAGIDLDARGETLGVPQFDRMARLLRDRS
jgi:16S rRNA (adenine1518-N6/adenine1519-N6)-dimethyltransferase